MGTGIPLRKVLIIEDEPSVRNTLYSLLASLGFDGDAAHSAQQALAMVSREQFDAVLIDLRCSDALTEEVVSGIHRIRPSLIGHALVVTGEVALCGAQQHLGLGCGEADRMASRKGGHDRTGTRCAEE